MAAMVFSAKSSDCGKPKTFLPICSSLAFLCFS
ncbi:Uncharacterised protein [Vibrio cholerae]|nr:Uncharacterised protein [Vibrio cholerae]CSI29613.1 Uncharacterised protein [Vibrio cholerae]